MKLSKRAKSIIGLSAIVVIIALAILWNTLIRTELTSAEVYVLKNDVVAGDKISTENITTRKIARLDVLKGAINSVDDAKKLLSMEARQFIPAGAQLVTQYFESPELVLKNGQFIFAVPTDWIVALPDTIRRKDTAYFYAFSTEDVRKLMNTSNMQPINTSAGLPSVDITTSPSSSGALASPSPAATPMATPGASAQLNETPATNNFAQNIIAAMVAGKEYQFNATVAYCKDKTNHEVINTEQDAGNRLDRYTGSSTIAHIEIIATEQQVDMMQQAVLEGYKFVVLYR